MTRYDNYPWGADFTIFTPDEKNFFCAYFTARSLKKFLNENGGRVTNGNIKSGSVAFQLHEKEYKAEVGKDTSKMVAMDLRHLCCETNFCWKICGALTTSFGLTKYVMYVPSGGQRPSKRHPKKTHVFSSWEIGEYIMSPDGTFHSSFSDESVSVPAAMAQRKSVVQDIYSRREFL